MHYCRRDSHATSQTAIYANITQTGRIWVYCSWFWVALVGSVGFIGGFGWFWVVLLVVLGGFVGGFGWFWVVPCFSNYYRWHISWTSVFISWVQLQTEVPFKKIMITDSYSYTKHTY